MDWRDEGVLLAVRPHGETSVIAEIFTAAHGRHLGVVRGGASRRMAAALQPGAQVAVTWRARLAEHVGAFAVEPLRSRAGLVLDDPGRLAALSSVCAVLVRAVPERDPDPALFAATVAALDAACAAPDWPRALMLWEKLLLEATGFGLDLETCAVTGAAEGLVWVSPRTGRAVSAAGAGDWAPRLLPLPEALRTGEGGTPADWAAGLRVTGHFLETRLMAEGAGKGLPEARRRLAAAVARLAGPQR